MVFPLIPLAVSAGIAALDGWVASTDVNAGRTAISKQRTLWVQGGAVALGLVGEFAGVDPNITEPAMGTGLALLAREVAFKAAQGGRTSPAAPQGYTAWAPAGAHGYVGAPGQPAVTYDQPTTVLG